MRLHFFVLFSVVNHICIRGSKIIVSLYAIKLGADPVTIGTLASIQAFFPFLVAVPAGRLSDRFGVKIPLIYGSFGMAVGILIPFFFQNLPMLFVSQAVIGFCYIFFHVSMHHLIGALGEGEERARNFNVFSLWASISGSIGPLLAGFSIDHLGYLNTYLLLGVLCVVPGVGMMVLPKSYANFQLGDRNNKDKAKESVLDLVKIGSLRKIFITSGIVLTGIELFSFYFPIYGNEIGLSASVIGLIMGIQTSAFFVIRLVMPALVKKFTEETVLCWSLILAGLTFMLFPFFNHVIVLTAVSFLLGLGLGCGQPLSIILTYNRSPAERAGEALGVRLTVNKFTQVVIPLLFGSLGSVWGLFPVFFSNGLLLMAGGYFIYEKKSQKKVKDREISI